MAFTNNFSTSFRWWDWICGTDTKYREYKQKIQSAKAAMKGASKEQLDAAERKLLDEIEKEGIKAEAEAEARGMGPGKTKVQ